MKRILQTTLLGAALLTAGVQAAGDPSANSRLLRAAAYGRVALVQKELPPMGNADVNAKDPYYGGFALMYAAGMGHLEIVNALIKAGADVNAKNSEGRTALMDAQRNKHADIVNALKAAGAK